ncbi:MAG TPA: hypothetical protein DCF84_04460 [Bacteroidetes bacterium]|nr:hypothetical protein [Bacteroidota bacterium]
MRYLFLFFLALTATSLQGQVSNSTFTESEALLEKVMDKYGDLDKLSVILQWTMDIPGNGKVQDVIEASRNGSAFQFENKDMHVTSDGVKVWTYMKDFNEAQIMWYKDMDPAMNPMELFNVYQDKSYEIISSSASGDIQTIVLKPRTVNPDIEKVTLEISTKRLELVATTMVLTDGLKNKFTFDRFELNQAPSMDAYRFTKSSYPGVTIVDLTK